uniref:DUF5641 domain-containing protein n=1 Tax=Haemonchus contortus TaxID=6289 RepID=A0A7I4YZT2_HAECO
MLKRQNISGRHGIGSTSVACEERTRDMYMNGKQAGKHEPRECMVVLLADDNLPGNTRKMGRISNLKPGKDGAIREVELHMPNGNILRRSINLLVPLDLNDDTETSRENQQPDLELIQRTE